MTGNQRGPLGVVEIVTSGRGLESIVAPVVEAGTGRHAALVVGAATPGGTCVLRHARDGVPRPDGTTVFEIGAVTMVLTATLLHAMAQAGEVGLDEPVQDLLPDGVRLPVRGRPITLLDLATHRSGLPRTPGRWLLGAPWPGADRYAGRDVDQVWQALARARRGPAGGDAYYSEFGMGLLGHLLERRSGSTYAELVESKVCGPLGLPDTTVAARPQDAARTAVGHDRRGHAVSHRAMPVLAAAGALRSTATDLLTLLAAQRAVEDTPVHRAVRAMQEPVARTTTIEVCAGWLVSRRRGTTDRVLWHDGSAHGFRSFVACIPERGIRVVVLAAGSRPIIGLGQRVLELLAGA